MSGRNLREPISRREFLHWSSAGVAGLYFSPFLSILPRGPEPLGRILDKTVRVYDAPSFSAKLIKIVWQDLIVPLYEVTVGDDEPSHNRVWYKISDNGFAHSGSIQPVEIKPNSLNEDIPEQGCLAEVTVPFCDALRQADGNARVAYRFYYGTTHWVTALVYDKEKKPWYQVFDDKWKYNYYVSPSHLRLLPPAELAPLSPNVPPEAKRLEIHLEEQAIIGYEWDQVVYTARAATGAILRNGNFTTPTGRFYSYHKRPFRHMAAGDFAAPNSYDLPGVPWVCYFTPEGISIHGTFWHNDFGRPRSHGCINVSIPAAKWIYLWTDPVVPASDTYGFEGTGTPIDIL